MKKIFVILALALVLCACGGKREVTAAMIVAMNSYAEYYETTYPDEQINTARICAQAPTGIYYKAETKSYIVTCKIPSVPKGWGIVFLDEYAVTSTCGIDANSQGQLEGYVNGIGFK